MKCILTRWLMALTVCLLLAACAKTIEEQVVLPHNTPTAGLLTPYATRTASSTPPPPDPATVTPFPTPTSTPRTHVVNTGEDMLSIAFRYGITLEELKAANPEVNPNLMSVDTVLIIPAASQSETTAGALPSPTAAGALLGEVICYPSAEGGLWCFAPVENPNDFPLESITAQVRLADAAGVQIEERTALTPLNLLPAHSTLPLMVYFPGPVAPVYQVNASFQTALPVQSGESRYLPAQIENLQIDLNAAGLSAQVSGEVFIPQNTSPVRSVWIAAIAYNAEGDINGVRRWENTDSLAAGDKLPFSLSVYSMGSPISKVDVFVEVRP